MSASTQEMQQLLDQFFEALGERDLGQGQLVIHFSDGGRYQGAEINKIHRPPKAFGALRRPPHA